MTNPVRCPICKQASETVKLEREVPVGKHSVLIEDEFRRCGCGNEFYLPDQLDRSQKLATATLRKKLGRVTPEEILALRGRYGLTQSELERALGLATKMVVRWERGTVLPSKAASSLIEVMIADPKIVARVLAAKGVRPNEESVFQWNTVDMLVSVGTTEHVQMSFQFGPTTFSSAVQSSTLPGSAVLGRVQMPAANAQMALAA